MTARIRQFLKQEFQDGERPSGADFADLIDSFLNQEDDGLSVAPDSTLVLSRGLGLGESSHEVAGTLRFSGGRVQFHNGTTWVDLASGGGGAFQPVAGGPHVAFGAGNVGIGAFPVPPTHRLEVNLGDNISEAERVRMGNAVVCNGSAAFQGFAVFAHRNQASNVAYALRQGPNGNVHLNAPAGQPVSVRHNGNQVRFAVSGTGNVVVGAEADLAGAGVATLQVQGGAFKTDGSNTWSVPSDVRLKEEIRDLEAGLAEILRVRPVRFRYNGKAGTPVGREAVGVVGQEIEDVFPEMVRRSKASPGEDVEVEDLLIYDGSALTYVLVNAVKEIAGKLEKLEAAAAGENGFP